MPIRSRHDTGLLPRRPLRARAARSADPGLPTAPAADPDREPARVPGTADAAGLARTPAAQPPEHPASGRRRANAYDRYSLLLQLVQVFPVVSAFLAALVADSVLAFVLSGTALAVATGLVVWTERTGRPYGLTASGTAPPGHPRILLSAERPDGALADPAGDPAGRQDTVSLLISVHSGTTTENVILHVALPRPRDEQRAPE